MATATDQQRELAAFLRSRRTSLVRAEFGLPQVRGGRTLGMRREEVAYLVGVSVTWYTWLEQGRSAHPSRQVIDAIAREMRMTPAEHAYVLALAGYGPPANSTQGRVPDHVQRLLDGWGRAPAFAITAAWDIVAWNRAYAALYPGVARSSGSPSNLMWAVFMDPYVRRMLPDWNTDSAHFVAEFRADFATHVSDADMKGLVHRLRATSVEFDDDWSRHDIERFSSRIRRFHHPDVGDLELEVHRLVLSDDPGLHLIVYAPVPGTTRMEALEALVGEASGIGPDRW
jgi:transcriptional regulator with XRE-family HTH domain